MNKILLLLIIISGFLVIFYANSEIFSRKTLLNVFHKEFATGAVIANNKTIGYYEPNQNVVIDHGHNREHHIVEPVFKHNHHNAGNSIGSINGSFRVRRNHTIIGHAKKVPYNSRNNDYNIFVIYTKENFQLQKKFELFAKSLLKYTTVKVHLHVITDSKSESTAEELLKEQIRRYHKSIYYTLYDVHDCVEKITDIVHAMMPFFSSNPSSYYSDALFYLSLGLHRIVDPKMSRAVLIDCDVVFRTDVRYLFDEFSKFSSDNLFGLAPELTPVYRHILYRFRANYPQTNFGSPYYSSSYVMHSNLINSNSINTGLNRGENNIRKFSKHKHKHIKHGYPGLNSGVVLMNFDSIRSSKLYAEALKETYVTKLANKYLFKGHLGDQDYFTLLGYEFPSLIYRLDCVWNRQLCTWWKDHGYSNVFDTYFHCEGKIKIYHGNCNTRVPE